jgi:hypothetical protein
MAEKAPGSPPAAATPAPEPDPSRRIELLQEQLAKAEAEAKTLEGRLSNRNPGIVQAIQAENDLLRQRSRNLRKAIFLLIEESLGPSQPAEAKLRTEALRAAGAEYCKKNNINPDLWKNIES